MTTRAGTSFKPTGAYNGVNKKIRPPSAYATFCESQAKAPQVMGKPDKEEKAATTVAAAQEPPTAADSKQNTAVDQSIVDDDHDDDGTEEWRWAKWKTAYGSGPFVELSVEIPDSDWNYGGAHWIFIRNEVVENDPLEMDLVVPQSHWERFQALDETRKVALKKARQDEYNRDNEL